jgi:hypothetical protein
VAQEARLKPYVLAGYESGELNSAITKVENLLVENGFNIAGKYSPMEDHNRMVICASHPSIIKAVKTTGELTAFASIIKFGFLKTSEEVEISYSNPLYWGNAYFRKDFPEVEADYKQLIDQVEKMFKNLTREVNQPYGSEKGLTVKKLRKYHYMIFMPYFDDVVKLAKRTNYENKLKQINTNFLKNIGKVKKVYQVDFPELQLSLFGVGLLGERGEKHFLPKIDKKDPRHLTFLPYEFLVMKDKVVMLHGKFRIAISFPDLSMGTFMKISSTPGDIKNYLRLLVTL